MSSPTPIVIETVQYTPMRNAMLVQIAAVDRTHPLLGQSRLWPITQTAAAGMDDQTDLDTIDWSDAGVATAVVDYFAGIGLSVSIAEDPGA